MPATDDLGGLIESDDGTLTPRVLMPFLALALVECKRVRVPATQARASAAKMAP